MWREAGGKKQLRRADTLYLGTGGSSKEYRKKPGVNDIENLRSGSLNVSQASWQDANCQIIPLRYGIRPKHKSTFSKKWS